VGSWASFSGVQALNLSTATGLRLGSSTFDVLTTDQAEVAGLAGTPGPGSAGLSPIQPPSRVLVSQSMAIWFCRAVCSPSTAVFCSIPRAVSCSLPSRLVLACSRPLSFSGGQVSTGTPSRAPGSNATLSLAAKNQFTVTNDFVQGPGNQIRGTEGTALTIAGQGSIDGGSLIAGPGGALPARQCRPVV
jgi:hypothetical protein